MSADPFQQGFDPDTGERVKNAMITELWAWVGLDEIDGSEGVLAMVGPYGAMPLVGADRNRIESLREYAVTVAKLAGSPIELRRFTNMEVIERLTPAEGGQ